MLLVETGAALVELLLPPVKLFAEVVKLIAVLVKPFDLRPDLVGVLIALALKALELSETLLDLAEQTHDLFGVRGLR